MASAAQLGANDLAQQSATSLVRLVMAEAPAAGGRKKQPAPSEGGHEKRKDEPSGEKGATMMEILCLAATDASEAEGEGQNNEQAIPEDSWFYLDTSQTPQGPFTWEQMSTWHKCGYLKADLPVRYASLSCRKSLTALR